MAELLPISTAHVQAEKLTPARKSGSRKLAIAFEQDAGGEVSPSCINGVAGPIHAGRYLESMTDSMLPLVSMLMPASAGSSLGMSNLLLFDRHGRNGLKDFMLSAM